MVVRRCGARGRDRAAGSWWVSSSALLLVLGMVVAGCGGGASESPQTAGTSVPDPTQTTTGPMPTTGAGSTTSSIASRPTTTRRPPPTTAKDPGGGLGAPFDIPPIVISQGFSKPEAREAAEEAFRKACGADPCRVSFVDVDPAPVAEMAHCTIVFSGRTDPPAGRKVRRGSVVKLIFMYSPGCAPRTSTTGTT
jgi:hypothetical protein